jgi:hypothetical protein
MTMNGLNKFLCTITKMGKIQPVWDHQGYQELVLMDELRVIAAKMRAQHGNTVKLPPFMDMIVKHLKAKYQSNGYSTIGFEIHPCTQTIRNMMTLLTILQEQEILDFVPQKKTNTHFTVEKSLMSAMSFATTMAGMHFIVRSEVGGILELPTKNISEGASLMIKKLLRQIVEHQWASSSLSIYFPQMTPHSMSSMVWTKMVVACGYFATLMIWRNQGHVAYTRTQT